eukprot:2268374-Amphidinium_carterae.2
MGRGDAEGRLWVRAWGGLAKSGRYLSGMQVQTNLGRRSDWFQFDIREPQGRFMSKRLGTTALVSSPSY